MLRAGRYIIFVVALSAAVARPDPNDALRLEERNKVALWKHLQPVLEPRGGAARLYFEDCTPNSFPRFSLQSTAGGQMGLAAVREIFKKDKRVLVTQGPSGIVRIYVGKAPLEILRTKIHFLKFTTDQRYTPKLALIAIESARDVEAAMRDLKLEHPLVWSSIHVTEARRGLPHLPSSIAEVTLDEAYDLVARTFGGMIVYKACVDSKWPSTFSAYFDSMTRQQE
jgi:hypothetical protein